uniref:Ig-like domain-containing protein n=1 Tax=Astatotilapia calliptera TaxID=8154 RepID=A0A3P8NXE4_ASTCA
MTFNHTLPGTSPTRLPSWSVLPTISMSNSSHSSSAGFVPRDCSGQSISDNDEYLYMFWYKHTDFRQMQLLTYSINKGIQTTEAPFNETKYFMSRPAVRNSSLHIKRVEPGDSAVYYCASRLPQ